MKDTDLEFVSQVQMKLLSGDVMQRLTAADLVAMQAFLQKLWMDMKWFAKSNEQAMIVKNTIILIEQIDKLQVIIKTCYIIICKIQNKIIPKF